MEQRATGMACLRRGPSHVLLRPPPLWPRAPCRPLPTLPSGPQVSVDHYVEWIQSVAELTVYALNNWQWAGSSSYYLLGLWSRLVSSMPYLKASEHGVVVVVVGRGRQAWGCTAPPPRFAAVEEGGPRRLSNSRAPVPPPPPPLALAPRRALPRATLPACWRPTCPPLCRPMSQAGG